MSLRSNIEIGIVWVILFAVMAFVMFVLAGYYPEWEPSARMLRQAAEEYRAAVTAYIATDKAWSPSPTLAQPTDSTLNLIYTLVNGRCFKCIALGVTSTVRMDQSTEGTLMAWQPYYDEKGVYHDNDPNTYTQRGRCSRGHEIVVVRVEEVKP